jgi:hypothetical protein
VIWGALDPGSRILYLYSEYQSRDSQLLVNVQEIQSRGAEICGVMDFGTGPNERDEYRLREMNP